MDPGSRSALEYSRDGQAPVLHEIEGIILIIRAGLFFPDLSRAKRWKRSDCKSLNQCISFLSSLSGDKEDDDTGRVVSELETDGCLGQSDSQTELSISSISDSTEHPNLEAECNTSGEDREAEVAAPIVGALVAQGMHYELSALDVFQHIKSGCCHIAKDTPVDVDDGETIVLRCGKIATRNFKKFEDVENFMPYKCTRCFTSNFG